MPDNDISLQVTQLPARRHVTLISAAYLAADEIASRSEKRLPGISKFFRTKTILVVGRTKQSHLGSFAADSWTHSDERLHEIHLNADRRCGHPTGSTGEDATVTLAHELTHLYAHEQSIRDTSNRGRYHSKRFARTATELGCNVVRPTPAPHGFVTDRLADWARNDYRDLIATMDEALVLHAGTQRSEAAASRDELASPAPAQANGKYVFARCQCVVSGYPRTLRMSVRQWATAAVWCGGCREPFRNSAEQESESQPFWSSSRIAADALPEARKQLVPLSNERTL